MVAFLEKSTGSAGFHQIIDFLNRSHICYALTKKPEVCVSFIKQFWRSAEASTDDNGEVKINATIDGHSLITSSPSHSPAPSTSHSPEPSTLHSPNNTTASASQPSPTQPSPTHPSPRAEHHYPTPMTSLSMLIGVLEADLMKTKKTYCSAYTKLILTVKKLESQIKIGKARRQARVVLSDDEGTVTYTRRSAEKRSRQDKGKAIMIEEEHKKKSKKELNKKEHGSGKQKSPEKSLEKSLEKMKSAEKMEEDDVAKETGAKRKKSIPRKSTRKRQKMEEDAEKEELKGFLDIIPREETFDRLDVEELYRLVKERYSASRPEGFDLMLWGDLHTLFEPDEDDEIWKDQHEYKLFQVTPKASHLHAVKRIFRYLKHQPKLGLWYPRNSPFELEAFLYSDYAGASLDRKSTTGGCQFLGRRLISWQCKKQTIVANSTTEAEYVAVAYCCGQVLWIQNHMMDYGFNFMNTKIHIDNEITICVVKNPVYHSRTKQNEIRHHFIRDCYEKRLIDVLKIHTDSNVADLLTKGFDVSRISMDLRMDRSSPGKYNSSMVYLRYALIHNPTIYDSLVKQFWQTATVRTLANGTQQLIASIDSKEYTITEASVRRTSEGSAQPTEPHPTPVDPLPSISSPLPSPHHPSPPPHSPLHSPPHSPLQSPPHPSSPPHSPPHSLLQSPPHSLPHSPHQSPPFSPPYFYHLELMDIVPKLVSRIETLETELQQTKTTYGKAVLTLVKRVKILEKSLKRKTHKVVIYGSKGEEPEDQGRKIQDIDDDPLVSLVRESMKMKEKSTDFVTPTKDSGEAQEEDIS
ncbi:hypothetical protein Tco_1087059, partial [Tanacetum coccineum]